MTVPDLIALASKPASEEIGNDDTRDMGLQRPDENHLGQLAPALVPAVRPVLLPIQGYVPVAILSFFTLNGLWVGFPLFNRAIVLRHYHRMGWVQG